MTRTVCLARAACCRDSRSSPCGRASIQAQTLRLRSRTGITPRALVRPSIAVGDLNGDSVPDLAVANFSASGVSVLLGNPDGTMQAQQTCPRPGPALGLRRRRQRRRQAGPGRRQLRFQRRLRAAGQRQRDLPGRATFAAGTNPAFVAVGDLNGDGKPDLAAANYGSADVSVLLGQRRRDVPGGRTFAAGTNPHWRGRGRLQRRRQAGPGRGQRRHPSNVSVLLGNGDGTFQAARTLAVGSGSGSVAAGRLQRRRQARSGRGQLRRATTSRCCSATATAPSSRR